MTGRRAGMFAAGAFALAKLAVHAACLTPYGWFRDELYYLACSEHLAWGYVDHPPLSVALLRAWRLVFGDSLAAVRLGPALAGAATVALTGALTLELGGGVVAVSLACLAVLAAPAFLAFGHFWSMNVFDELAWIAIAWLAVRAMKHPRPWRWVALGVALGLGLLDKWSVAWLAAGLALGIALSPRRRLLLRPWPWIAAAIAAVFVAPHLGWQARHGWPTLEFMRNALGHKYVPLSPGAFLRHVFVDLNPAALPLEVAAVVHAWRRRREADGVLALMVAFGATLALLLTQRSAKPEYLVAAFPMLFACGAVGLERALSQLRRPGWRLTLVALQVLALVGACAPAVPFVLPVLGEETFVRYQAALGITPSSSEQKELGELPQHYADMHGWPELAAAVGTVWQSLSPSERAGATLVAASGGYGSAAALDFFGKAHGLPPARSTHNNYWLWGPGDGDGRVVLVVGGDRAELEPLFASVTEVARFECRYCMPYENHKPIYVARGLVRPLAELWPSLKHFE